MRRPVALAVAVLVVVAVGSTATAQRGTTAATVPSSVPAAEVGHHGNPVTIANGAFHVSGTAGTLVHVHLADPLEPHFGSDYDRRIKLTTDADIVMVAFAPERGRGYDYPGPGSGQATIAIAKPRFMCAKADTCQQDHAMVYQSLQTDFSPMDAIPAGDYVMALLGPIGAHIDLTYLDYYGRQRPSEVTHLYPMPYAAGMAVDIPLPNPPNPNFGPGDRDAQYIAPLLGARVLGGVAVAIEDSVGDSEGFGLETCSIFGRWGPTVHNDPKNDPVQCPGWGGLLASEGIHGHDPNTGASVPAPYAVLRVESNDSEVSEDTLMGGGYGLDCASHCQSRAYAFNIALDS